MTSSQMFEDECEDGDIAWHKGDEGYWEGNPATAPIVFRAVNEANWLQEQRKYAREAAEKRATVGAISHE